jgi:hypothetical protein
MPVVLNPNTPPVVGFWTNSTLIDRYLGQTLGDQLSNVDNNQVGSDPAGYNDAIIHAENWINYQLRLFGYPSGVTSPQFPTTSLAFGVLSDAATMIAAYWLYAKRGIFDKGDEVSGKFAKVKNEGEGMVNEILRNKIQDVPRSFNSRPALLTSGLSIGTPASSIPVVP